MNVKILTIFLISAFYFSNAQDTQIQGTVRTSRFTREALTNETALGWRTKLQIGTNGVNYDLSSSSNLTYLGIDASGRLAITNAAQQAAMNSTNNFNGSNIANGSIGTNEINSVFYEWVLSNSGGSGGGSGVSNATALSFVEDAWATNSTPYFSIVSSPVGFGGSPSDWWLMVDTDLNGTHNYYTRRYFQTIASDQVDAMSIAVPAGAAFRFYRIAGSSGGSYGPQGGLGTISYWSTNSGGGSGTIADGSITTNKVDAAFHAWVESATTGASLSDLNFSSNALRTLTINSSNKLDTDLRALVTATTNGLSTRLFNATNKLDTDLRALTTATTNGLRTAITDATNGLAPPMSDAEFTARAATNNAGNLVAGVVVNAVDGQNITNIDAANISGDLSVDNLTAGTITADGIVGTLTNNITGSARSTDQLQYATNGPVADLHSQWPLPVLGFDTWASWQIDFSDYRSNIVERWITNLANTIYTNGLSKEVGVIWIDDGWTAPERDSGGDLTWNTNIFPATLPSVISMCGEKGVGVILYSARGTNTCGGLPGSPTNTVYRDIFRMMDWGAAGCFFDSCNNTVAADRRFTQVWARLARQAVLDYQALAFSTGGVVRPFYIVTATGNGADNYPSQISTPDLFQLNSVSWNWNDQTSTIEGFVTMAKDTLKFLGPYIKPGFYPDALRVYAPQMVDSSRLNQGLAVMAMTCQQLRIGAGDTQVGSWTNTAYAGGYGEGYSWYQMTNKIVPVLGNQELLNVWRDPLVSPAKIVWTNQLSELWVKRLVKPEKKAFTLLNLAATNCALSVNVTDFGGFSNVVYKVRNVLSNSTESIFANQFSYTVGPSNVVLFTVEPAETEWKQINNEAVETRWQAASWKGINFNGTGLSAQTVASPMGSPFVISEGMYQSGANNFWQHGLVPPAWATNVTLAYCVYSDFAGIVAWTNAVRAYYYPTAGSLQVQAANTNWTVVTTSGAATWVTNSAIFITTNAPREIIVTFGASSNTSPRRVVGPLLYRFQ